MDEETSDAERSSQVGQATTDLEHGPVPVPSAVTGVPVANQPGLLIALGATVALLLCGGLGFVGLAVASRLLLSSATSSAPAAITSTESELRQRVDSDYPGYRIDSFRLLPYTIDGSQEMGAYILLTDRAEPGFALTTYYSAPVAEVADVTSFGNFDEFFVSPGSLQQPIDTFVAMWVRHHPSTVCTYVADRGDSEGTVRRFEAGGAERATGGGMPEGEDTVYLYDYDTVTEEWSLTTQAVWDERDAAAEAATAELDAADDDPSYDEYVESTDPLPVLVAKLLPGFEYRGAVDIGDGCVYALLRHKRYPAMRMVIDEASLRLSPAQDDALAVLGGSTARGTAFARTWAARRPGTVIWVIQISPAYDDGPDTVGATYFDSIESLKSPAGMPDDARCRWDPKAGTWTIKG